MNNIEHRVKKLEETAEPPSTEFSLEDAPMFFLKEFAVSLHKDYPEGFIVPLLEDEFRKRGFTAEQYAQFMSEAAQKAAQESAKEREDRLAYFYVLASQAYPDGDPRLAGNENFQRGKELFETRTPYYTELAHRISSLERDIERQKVSAELVWAEFTPDGLALANASQNYD